MRRGRRQQGLGKVEVRLRRATRTCRTQRVDLGFQPPEPARQKPPICPDNVAFDPHGNPWIATDGNTRTACSPSLSRGSQRGHVKQSLTVPKGAETCGPILTEARVPVAAQHPGKLTGATAEKLASTWRDGPGSIPRPSVVTVWTGLSLAKGTKASRRRVRSDGACGCRPWNRS
ncbi:alkaline phosphatase PhoX [Streptomyces griseoaurantiacus]|uniref:alkaline phosphatase PhoX n=1 Tax=Streptomyces griseoaurantiacus TaxID=68213 RepID=UPI002E2B6CE0|nr:alkaline phosphatase PhoX [Streptomyces jietaisiensis]